MIRFFYSLKNWVSFGYSRFSREFREPFLHKRLFEQHDMEMAILRQMIFFNIGESLMNGCPMEWLPVIFVFSHKIML